eukprot:6659499-Ditylum_brightwellii.AAC.1
MTTYRDSLYLQELPKVSYNRRNWWITWRIQGSLACVEEAEMNKPIPRKKKSGTKKEDDNSTSGRKAKCQDKHSKSEKCYEKHHNGRGRRSIENTMDFIIIKFTSAPVRLLLQCITAVMHISRKSKGLSRSFC